MSKHQLAAVDVLLHARSVIFRDVLAREDGAWENWHRLNRIIDHVKHPDRVCLVLHLRRAA